MLARDEREDLRSGTGVVEGQKGDGQPVERSKPRVGHGVLRPFSNQNKLFSEHWLHTFHIFR